MGESMCRQQAPGEGHTRHGWLGVASIAAGTFLLVATEFLPIGLLSRLALDLHVSEGRAGLSVTAPGFVAALAAPLLVVLAGAMDRRAIIVALTATIVASNVMAALAPDFPVFLASRLMLGLAVAGLWSFAVAAGRRLVPESAGARATSIISAGISAGTVFGMPVGASLDGLIGWRMVFAANAALGLLVVLVQLRYLPRLVMRTAIRASQLFAFARIPMAAAGLLASGFVAAGHFVAYTFLEPYLRNTLALGATGVTLTLAGYAATGIVGSFVGERLAGSDVRRAFAAAAALLAASVLLAVAARGSPAWAIAVVMLWGAAFGAVPVCVQMWMFNASPALYEAGSALMVSAFQISLAAGAAIGGVLVDNSGLDAAFLVSGFVSAAGVVIALMCRAAPAATHRSTVVLENQQ
ncbi:putative MFS family arabinose efflux permease [Paraburkholderia caballeronis]|nr:putative MFS family arabinose efflux permease [Paraburkholderia caballeronis]